MTDKRPGTRRVGWPVGLPPNCQIQKVLGDGGEGRVYLVADVSTNNKSVVKIFRSPRTEWECRGLRAYADCVTGEYPGLPKLGILENEDGILGVSYEYHPLYEIHYRLWGVSRHLARAVIGSYCRMQSYLMSTAGIVLWDADVVNFLLARDGQFHWVDFGWSVQPIDDSFILDQGGLGYGFAMLLLSAHGVNIKPLMLPGPGYSLTQPCRYCLDPRLDALATRHSWLRQVLDEIRQQPSAAFLDPEFYKRLGSGLPDRVAIPRFIILFSNLLRTGGRLRAFLWRSIQKEHSVSASEPSERD